MSGTALSAQDWSGDFAAIDRHARQTPPEVEDNLPALTAYLTNGSNTDLEKVRAIYVWITTHIRYDRAAGEQDKRINHSIRDILDRRQALCVGYAQLFREMCVLAGLSCEIVNGYAKGTSETSWPIQEPNHSWNAVKIGEEWYLLDATWGSSTLNKRNDFVQISSDAYFLVPPEELVKTHLPGNPMWQLLTEPVSAATFMGAGMQGAVDTTDGEIYAFRDSLRRFLSLTPERKRLWDYERTFASYPTIENGEQLGHALIDYAGLISDSLEQLNAGEQGPEMLNMHLEIMQYCRRAIQLASLYNWQQELYVNTLINHVVLLYNWPDEDPKPPFAHRDYLLSILEEAQQILLAGEDSYFNRMARRQCADYMAIIRELAP